MPFLLPILGVLFGLALAGSALLSRPWSRARAALGLGIALGIAGLVWVADRAHAQVELNPRLSSPRHLAGAWRFANSTLILTEDGGWRCAGGSKGQPPCDGATREGRW